MATTRKTLRRQKAVDLDQKPRSKANTKSLKPTRRDWEGPEWCTLLAHLEWSVKVKKDFWNEGFPKFNKAVGSPFTKIQVRGKLKREWGNYGRKIGQNTYNDAFKLGLRAYHLPKDVLDKVKPPLDSLHNSESSSCDTSIEVAAPRHEQECDGHQATTKGASVEPRRIARLRTSPRNLRAGGTGGKANPEVVEVPDDSEDELTSYRPADDATTRTNDTPSQRAETPGTQIWNDVIESKNKEIASLKNRIFLMENDKARLNDDLSELRRCDPDAEMKRRLEKMFDDSQARSQQNLSFDMDKRGLQKEQIVQCYEILYRNIHDACLDLVLVDGELPAQDFGFYYTAQSWARKTLNQNIGRCIQDIDMGRLSKCNVLMGLIAGAVTELVFVPAFLDVLSTPSPKAEFYRSKILLHNGPDELHKADLAILLSLMHYRKSEIIETKEKDLTEFITRSLGCFWTSRGAEQPVQQIPNDDLDVDMIEHPQEGLVCRSFLMSALDLKLKLTSSLTRLKYFFSKSCGIYDERFMCRASESNFESNRIIACFLPVLFFAPPRVKVMTSTGYVLEHDVHYNTYFTEATAEEVESLQLAAKAVVLT